MNKVMSNKKIITLYIAPALLLILALIYVPIVQTGYYGLMKWNGIGDMEFIGLK
ncbi:MAG TPA: sugar ABC transporter permease, partial [Bacillales bacterium]|nr:sugar ABC transporter permease [Bacillales bacterium]